MTRMQTVSQKWVNLADPTAAMIDFFDIAHALCRIPRFNGHTLMTRTVAAHTLDVHGRLAGFPRTVRLAGLLHDAAEAYIGDIIRPVRQVLGDSRLAEVEARLLTVIGERVGLSGEWWRTPVVVDADDAALRDEMDGRFVGEYPPNPNPARWLDTLYREALGGGA